VVASRSSSALPVAPSMEIRSRQRLNFGKTNFVSPFALHLKFVPYLLCELLRRVLVSYILRLRFLQVEEEVSRHKDWKSSTHEFRTHPESSQTCPLWASTTQYI